MQPIVSPYHLAEYLADLDVPLEPALTVRRDLPDGDVWARMAALYEPAADAVAECVAGGDLPVVMSGDCTTSLGVVAGLQRAGAAPSIVWFDAHGDLQTMETTTSGYLGGIPLRLLVGYRPELITERLGVTPVAEERVTLVDARDLDPPEEEFLAASPVRHVAVDEVSTTDLPDGPLYLHVDLDVIDPGDVPGQLFPAPGGPSVDAVAEAVDRVAGTGRLAAVGLGCTWHPGNDAAHRVGPVVEPLTR